MRSAERIWPVVTVQLVPSADHDARGSEPARRRADSTPSPSLIWRQPRMSTSKPRRRSCGAAPSITESPTASGGTPERTQLRGLEVLHSAAGRLRGRRRGRHGGRQRAYASPREVVFPSFEFAFFFPVVLALSWALMPHPRLWKPFILAASYVFYAAASPRYCLLLAGLTLGKPGGRTARAPHRGRAQAQVDRRRHGRRRPRRARRVQVLRLLRRRDRRASSTRSGSACRCPCSRSPCRSGCRFITFQAISYVVDVKRRLLPPARAARLRALPELLPARGGRPDRAGARVHPAARRSRATRATSPSAPASC